MSEQIKQPEGQDPAALEYDHPARNRGLFESGARYRFKGSKAWHPVRESMRIANSCFNDLGDAWTANAEWRVSSADAHVGP